MYNKFVFKFIFPIIIWIIPFLISLKIGKGDSRFFFRKIIFPYWYLLQRLFEKITKVRIACRVLHIVFLFVTFYGSIFVLYAFTGFNLNVISNPHFMFIVYYILIGTFVYLFQPKKSKCYETK